MGILSGLFSSTKIIGAAGDIISSVPAGIDKAIYTKEEQADDQKGRYALWLKLQETAAMENSAFSLARRAIALSVFAFYLGMYTLAAVAFIASLKWPDLQGSAGYFRQLAEGQQDLVMLIGVFYYGPGLLDKFWKGK